MAPERVIASIPEDQPEHEENDDRSHLDETRAWGLQGLNRQT